MLANPHPSYRREVNRVPVRATTDPKHAAEKNFVWETADSPYRKPTQVDEKSILRCSSEPWSRNSANWPRNFGISGVSLGEWLRATGSTGSQ